MSTTDSSTAFQSLRPLLERAMALGKQGRHGEAAAVLREAVRLDPRSIDAWLNLGVALEKSGSVADAADAYRRVIGLDPKMARAHRFLGNALRRGGRWRAAEAAERRAIELAPDDPVNYGNLATTLSAMGRIDEVIAARRKAVELQPGSVAAGSALLTAMHYCPTSTPRQLLAEAREWAGRCGLGREVARGETSVSSVESRQGAKEQWQGVRGEGRENGGEASVSSVEPGRGESQRRASSSRGEREEGRLRVGFFSGNAGAHPEGRLLRPVLANLDRDRFETFVYCNLPKPDAVTEVLRGLADQCRDIAALDDARAEQVIRDDRIDILVDMTGHFGNSRLPLLARKPAAVQAIWFGYPGTTGLDAIDWRITDEFSDPPGADEEPYTTEKLLRLKGFCWCYEPPVEARGVAARPPGRPIVFICPNNPLKVSSEAIEAWAQILKSVSGSRLEMLAEGGGEYPPEGSPRHHFHVAFARRGVDPSRILLLGRQERSKYFEWIHGADIALDPFPYNGGVSTCDTLWMGVPVISLKGNSYWSQQGDATLRQVGLEDLVAGCPQEYVDRAMALARDSGRLREIRLSLRLRMRESAICDCPALARRLGDAFWHVVRSE